MTAPVTQFFQRMVGDKTITSFAHLQAEMLNTDVVADQIAIRINELTELQSLMAIALKELDSLAVHHMEEGRQVASMKFAPGRKTRKLISDDVAYDVLERFGVDASTFQVTKMVGVPAVEKLLTGHAHKDEIMDNIVITSVGAPSAKLL